MCRSIETLGLTVNSQLTKHDAHFYIPVDTLQFLTTYSIYDAFPMFHFSAMTRNHGTQVRIFLLHVFRKTWLSVNYGVARVVNVSDRSKTTRF